MCETSLIAREECARVVCVVFAQLRAIRVILQLRQRGETVATAGGSRAGLWLAWSLSAATVSFAAPSVEALVATALATLIFNCANAPDEVDNGGMWEWCLSAYLCLCPLARWAAGGSMVDGLFDAIPFIKVGFTLVYASAGFAKLNRDYFSYRTSSNTVFLVKLLSSPPFVGSRFGVSSDIMDDDAWIALFKAALVLLEIAELCIPILFWIGQPALGAAVNWLFHLFVGAAAYNFSCSGTGSLPIVLPMSSIVAGLRFMTTTVWARAIALGVTLWLVLSQSPQPGAPHARNRLHGLCVSLRTGSAEKNAIHLTWLVWELILGVGIARQIHNSPAHAVHTQIATCAGASTLGSAAGFSMGSLIASVFLLTCLAPYLGLPKTHSTFTMFSNLRVEGRRTNHFLYRSWMAPFGFLADMVTVTATDGSDRLRFFMRASGGVDTCRSMGPLVERQSLCCTIYGQLKKGEGPGGSDETNTVIPYRIPHIQLRSLIADERASETRRSFFVEYERSGVAHRFEMREGELISGDPGLLVPLPWLLRPWIFCRAVQCSSVGYCYH